MANFADVDSSSARIRCSTPPPPAVDEIYPGSHNKTRLPPLSYNTDQFVQVGGPLDVIGEVDEQDTHTHSRTSAVSPQASERNQSPPCVNNPMGRNTSVDASLQPASNTSANDQNSAAICTDQQQHTGESSSSTSRQLSAAPNSSAAAQVQPVPTAPPSGCIACRC